MPGPELIIADYSQWQGVVRPPAGQVVIIRAHNGSAPDPDFAANRANAHAAGCPAVGIYQYLPATADASSAAGEFCQLVDPLAANEWPICDLEEGQGDQQPRWWAWLKVVQAWTRRSAWLYSGLAFAEAHDLMTDWVAAYGQADPTVPHKLWQYTDAYPWPWGASDASVFDGSLPEFLAAAGITLPGPVVPARPLQEATMQALVDGDGTLIVVGEAADNGDLMVFTRPKGGAWSVGDVTEGIHNSNPADPRSYKIH